MLSRAQVRRWVLSAGVGVGALGLLLYIAGAAGTYRSTTPTTFLSIGGGAWVYSSQGVAGGVGSSRAFEWGLPTYWYFLPRWRSDVQGYERIVVPFWILVLIGVCSAYFLLPENPAKEGHCPGCGFDLRKAPPLPDNPTAVRCPECGRVTRRAAQPPTHN